MIRGVFGDGGRQLSNSRRVGGLAQQVDLGFYTQQVGIVGFGWRDERQSCPGAFEIARFDLGASEPGDRLWVFAIDLENLGIELPGCGDIARSQEFVGGFQHGCDFIARGIDRETRYKLTQLTFGQRPHEAIHRLAVHKSEHGWNRLYAHLGGELLIFVDVYLDQANSAFFFVDDLFQHWSKLLAGSAPGRPEVDQHRRLTGSLDHVSHEVLGVGLLYETLWSGRSWAGTANNRHRFTAVQRGGCRTLSGGLEQKMQSEHRRDTFSSQGKDFRIVTAGADEFQEVRRRNRGGGPIFQGMVVQQVMAHHLFFKDYIHGSGRGVDQGKGRDGARIDAQDLAQDFRPAER